MATPLPEHLSAPAGGAGRTLVVALLALLVLTGLSWWLAHVELGSLQTVVALAIAAVKATLVAFFFMELGHASTTARVIVVVVLSFIALLCLGVVADSALR